MPSGLYGVVSVNPSGRPMQTIRTFNSAEEAMIFVDAMPDSRTTSRAWQDCGEGPWTTLERAMEFGDAEVGATHRYVWRGEQPRSWRIELISTETEPEGDECETQIRSRLDSGLEVEVGNLTYQVVYNPLTRGHIVTVTAGDATPNVVYHSLNKDNAVAHAMRLIEGDTAIVMDTPAAPPPPSAPAEPEEPIQSPTDLLEELGIDRADLVSSSKPASTTG